MAESSIVRRDFIKTALAVGVASVVTKQAVAEGTSKTDFKYEVTRTEAEWKSMFESEVYNVLRKGRTEWPESSEWWDNYSEGVYHCLGCDLENYTSVWKVNVNKGWAFFTHSEPNTILMGIDGLAPDGMSDDASETTIETHCRRCGSHMGHILQVGGKLVHCVNGSALGFTPA